MDDRNISKCIKRYVSLETLKHELDTKGYAVLKGVLTPEECDSVAATAAQDIAHMTKDKVLVSDRKTWKNWFDFFPLHSMLVQYFGAGHLPFLWRLRQHPAVVNVFTKLWGVPAKDLLVSFDGFSVHFPPEETNRGWYKGSDQFHTDQSPMLKGLQCIQSFISLYDVAKDDATFSFIEKSHLLHESFFNHKKETEGYKFRPDNWYKLTEGEDQFFLNQDCKKIRVICERGSMVLWDSRLMHTGVEPRKERVEEKIRLVGYVCMTPRSMATEKDLFEKRKAFEDKRTCRHTPHAAQTFPKIPKTYGKPLPETGEIREIELTALGKRLAGYDTECPDEPLVPVVAQQQPETQEVKTLRTAEEKRVKALQKKLQEIEKLKLRRENGDVLEANQLTKIEGEALLKTELESLL